MRREIAFKSYLKKYFSSAALKDYPTHCKGVEKSMNNKDMDDIIINYKDLCEVKNNLLSNGYPIGYMSGFNAYLKFAFSCPTASPAISLTKKSSEKGKSHTPLVEYNGDELEPFKLPKQGGDQPTDHVFYAQDVLPDQQVPGLCSFLEDEYNKIVDFACQIFGQYFKNVFPQKIDIELRKECPSKIYINGDDYITGKINELIAKGKEINSKVTSNILRFCDRIAGVFISSPEPKIVIYFNQLAAANLDEYHAAIAQTLAHEYAHYCEYIYCKNNDENHYQNEYVSEAIADFFGVLYSLKRGTRYDLDVAKKRHDLWKERYGSIWPYAYALYFYIVENTSFPFTNNLSDYYTNHIIDKLVAVFRETPNTEIAFDKLTK